MKIQLSDHFTYAKLLRFAAPSICMMIFTSVYWIVDGLFIAKYAGVTSFAAINLVWPFIMVFSSIGFMLGSGGNALVAKTLGEQRKIRANRIFSLLIYTTFILGILLSAISLVLLEPLLLVFGAGGDLLSESLKYGRILLPFISFSMLQYIFQCLFVTAERPIFGFVVTFVVGITNIILDALFIVHFQLGISGAAIATAISWGIGCLIPLLYFALPNTTSLRLGKTGFYAGALLKICSNGLSEFVSVISQSVVCALYNYQMLRIAGERGIAAYGIIAYLSFIFIAVFLGYSFGTAPVVSYHYGAGNKSELKNLSFKNLVIIGIFALILTSCSEIFAHQLIAVFAHDNLALAKMAVHGFRIFALSFLLSGFSLYASAFFTALNNGLVSAVISCCRTLLFECLSVIILPIFFGLSGIWAAIIVAEVMAVSISAVFFIKLRPQYGY